MICRHAPVDSENSMNEVIFQYSDDHGHTWSSEMWRAMVGDDKNYLTRFRLQHQGAAHQRVYRIVYTYPASFTLISAHASIDFGI